MGGLNSRSRKWQVSQLTGPGHRTRSRADNDTTSIGSDSSRYHDALEDQATANDEIKAELTHVLADMGSLRGRLQGDFRSNYAVSDLASYLDAMQLYATNLGHRMNGGYRTKGKAAQSIPPIIPGKSMDRGARFPSSGTNSSMGDEPDSAIDMNDGPPSPYQQSPTVDNSHEQDRRAAPPNVSSLPIIEIDEFLDELSDERDRSSRPPTPPPKAEARRFSTVDHVRPLATARPALSMRSVSDYDAMARDADDDDDDMVPRRRRDSIHSHMGSDDDARSTLGSLLGIRPPFSEATYDGTSSNPIRATTTTTITGGLQVPDSNDSATSKDNRTGRTSSRLFGRKNSFSVPGRTTRPDVMERPPSRSTSHNRSLSLLNALSGPGAALAIPAARVDAPASSMTLPAHVRKASADTTVTVATTCSGGKAPRTSTSTAAASIRSSGSRMSSVFSKMTSWKTHRIKEEPAVEDTEPDDVFGVSLKKSMQMASATVRTHHNGSRGSSRREFPRVILTCVSFIKENDGVKAPNLFGEDFSMDNDTDHLMRVAELKHCFRTAPHYGDGNIAWEQYDVYDAAEMIIMFLQQLPKPLVTETVAKRWIVLSRQASLPGSMGLRLDSCIDFWDEALLGVRGPARSLFKLLLNLWGDIADAADINDMTAERLAARMLNPLMHLPAGKYTTDLMLGLAFLIRKRSEYAIMLREGRPSRAAF